MSSSTGSATYLFGHSDEETNRLQKQAGLFNPSTRRLLKEAGLSTGMDVLDVGSGAGDVTLLLADLVGDTGSVLGIDRNPRLLNIARARARDAGARHVSFLVGDVATITLDRDFDAVVGRCVLFFLQDPLAVVRRLIDHLRPGGVVAFQEPGNAVLAPYAVPASPVLDQMWQWIMEVYRRSHMDLAFGLQLRPLFLKAGLPEPEMHLDAAVGGGPDWAGYDYMASLIRTLLPQILQHGIATEREVDIETLADRLHAESEISTTWSFVSAWAHKE